MPDIWAEALIILVLILGNGFFAGAEIAVVKSRKPRLESLARGGSRKARRVLDLMAAPTRFLSTVQFGITLIGILAGAFGGARIALELATYLEGVKWIGDWANVISLGAVVACITLASLVLGEIVPKRLAMINPERAAMMIAGPVGRLGRLALPFVQLTTWLTERILGMMNIRVSEPVVTEEEVQVLVEEGTHAGVFHQAEVEMVEGVMALDEEQVGDLMTPRPKIVWLNADEPDKANWAKIVSSNHSHFPLYSGNRDNVIGMVSVKALWANLAAEIKTDIRNLAVKPLVVPETMVAVKLLETFKQSGRRIALVCDEFGSVIGLVSIIDLLEAIVGDIPSEGEDQQPSFVKREDGSWLIDAMMEVDEFKKLLGLGELPSEEDDDYLSVGGFVLSMIGQIPVEGDTFVHEGWKFEIVDMDRHRIDKILASPLPLPEEGKE